MQRFVISAMLIIIFAASVSHGQTARSTGVCHSRTDYRDAEANTDRNGTDYDLASMNSRARISTDFEFLTNVDEGLLKEFEKAWRASGAGVNPYESVVLIFRQADGSFSGRSQGFSNEYHKFSFKWIFNALAIVHTHPDASDPKPGEQDKRVADKYCVPNFTITRRGMYVYDPATKKTSKVFNGLDWLKISTYPDDLKRWLGSGRRRVHTPGF